MNDYSSTARVTELFVGRKLVAVSKDIRLSATPELTQVYTDDPNSLIVTSQMYEVFVDGKLYAKVKAYPRRPRLHSPIWLSKDLSDGKVRLRLVKKYTELVAKID